MANTPVTVSSSDDYYIVVDWNYNNIAGENLNVKHGGAGTPTLAAFRSAADSPARSVESPNTNLKLHRSSGVVFWMSASSGDAVTWRHPYALAPEPALKATLTGAGALVLDVGSLVLPVLTSLPAAPTSGEWILFEDTDGGARRGRLAVYLNGGWRYSAAL